MQFGWSGQQTRGLRPTELILGHTLHPTQTMMLFILRVITELNLAWAWCVTGLCVRQWLFKSAPAHWLLSLRPLTRTGVSTRSLLLPEPVCPTSLAPQHETDPFCRRAHVWEAPADMVSISPSATTTGVGCLDTDSTVSMSYVPSPSWPCEFLPQQRAVWFVSTAQECRAPADT